MQVQDPKHPVKVQVTYAGLYGALLIAILINTFMYGVSLSIVLQYFKLQSKRDTNALKITIFLLITLATLETIFASHQLYDTFIINTGNPALIDRIPLQVTSFLVSRLNHDLFSVFSSVPGENACTYLNAFVAQLFFASRIWSVSKSLHSRVRLMAVPVYSKLASTIDLLGHHGSFFRFNEDGLNALVSIEAISKTFSNLTLKTGTLITVTTLQGATAAACDILISISLCYVLHSHRSGIKRTDSLINRMMIYAINRGIATSICALLGVILYCFVSGTYYFLIPLLATTHLYVISAVSILTLRESLREEINQSFHLSDLYTNTSRSDATDGRQIVGSVLTVNKNHQTV
ncbi:hypothetical protein M422DRAFT_257125 [Sphaerobolus stellatus SS14]|uniref:DUF6534 domain-containing protein n=1 Tax=Sphaerobolus stellatus (strain SS14) TaxID=990650 RepID=A0A0C9VPH9_SPHS4|nr:hypothetical protein M422DRAFT_257125 [Sphaerobolus stellatus SS14]